MPLTVTMGYATTLWLILTNPSPPVGWLNCLYEHGWSTPMSNDEKFRLQAVLRTLSQGRGVLRDNLYEAIAPSLRQRWEIAQHDDEAVVFANVRWQLVELIGKLKAPDARQIATYSFNLTDDPAIEGKLLVARQKALADAGGPSREKSTHTMTKVILPAFSGFILSGSIPPTPVEVIEAARAKAEQILGGETTGDIADTEALRESAKRCTRISATVLVVQNKYATGSSSLLEDRTPAYLSTSPEPYGAERGCKVDGTDMKSGALLAVTCWLEGAEMTNRDTTSLGIEQNPHGVTSKLWYRGVWPDGRTGYLSEVYVEAQCRGGLGLPRCES
jgi:hypothetical protein